MYVTLSSVFLTFLTAPYNKVSLIYQEDASSELDVYEPPDPLIKAPCSVKVESGHCCLVTEMAWLGKLIREW